MTAAAVNLGPLVRADGIHYGQGTKAELLHDDLQVGLGGLAEIQPRDGALVFGEALAELLGRIRVTRWANVAKFSLSYPAAPLHRYNASESRAGGPWPCSLARPTASMRKPSAA
jgi:hypothetical protein